MCLQNGYSSTKKKQYSDQKNPSTTKNQKEEYSGKHLQFPVPSNAVAFIPLCWKPMQFSWNNLPRQHKHL